MTTNERLREIRRKVQNGECVTLAEPSTECAYCDEGYKQHRDDEGRTFHVDGNDFVACGRESQPESGQ